MRKGRSSRRSRTPRSLAGSSPPSIGPLSSEEAPTDTEREREPQSPRIVLGLPPSVSSAKLDPPFTVSSPAAVLEERAARGPSNVPEPPSSAPITSTESAALSAPAPTTRAGASVAEPTVARTSETTLVAASIGRGRAPTAEVVPVESPKASFAKTLTFGSASDIDRGAETQRSVALENAGHVDVDTRRVASLQPRPREEVVAPPAAGADLPPRWASANEPGREPSNATERSHTSRAFPPAIDPDEISVPPMGDVVVEGFFSGADVTRGHPFDLHDDDDLTLSEKAKQKAKPHVVERRARFARYVTAAVGIAAIVCLAAALRTALKTAPIAEAPVSAVAVANDRARAAPDAPSRATPLQEAAATAAKAPTRAEPSAVPAAAPPEVASNAAVAPVAAAPADSAASVGDDQATELTGDAKEEKSKARVALEKRKLVEAIEAGQRSVRLDPTDGEAWLLLGAAHQERGSIGEARKAYAACVKEAKTGPRQECAKMLR